VTTLEKQARALWLMWGVAWAMRCRCSKCNEIHECRGQKRSRMLCLDCYDQGGER
jgi:hypothetical protein